MKITNTAQVAQAPTLMMLVYGDGGVGKTTFASTAPKPILADCENGSKFLGARGISMDVAQIQSWQDFVEFCRYVRSSEYETVVIDPIGELMDKLKRYLTHDLKDPKLVQRDGSPTMAGWGWLKQTMRAYLKGIRDMGKNVILVAHVDEKGDEDKIVKRPRIETKISKDVVEMSELVGYMTIVAVDGESRRIIVVEKTDKIEAKDRTGLFGKMIENPNFAEIVGKVRHTLAAIVARNAAVDAAREDSKPAQTPTAPAPAATDAPEAGSPKRARVTADDIRRRAAAAAANANPAPRG